MNFSLESGEEVTNMLFNIADDLQAGVVCVLIFGIKVGV